VSYARLLCRTLVGIEAVPVVVEVHLSGGLPATSIVGMAETAVKEARERVKAAIRNSHFDYPAHHVTINLSPADLPKQGGQFDLPIALGILAASNQITQKCLEDLECVGELGLSGNLRAVSGTLPISLAVKNHRHHLVVPAPNAQEASLSALKSLYTATNLIEVCALLENRASADTVAPRCPETSPDSTGDMSDVRGQYHVKRALEIAAAGGHNLLLSGPPGTGKSMLASRLPGIMPPMSLAESMETASVSSVSSRGFNLDDWGKRPFRAPHHTASGVALVGGGTPPKPGEISLAHHGILFLDELPEFSRGVLEVLREPMETGSITISRASWQSVFPARFQVVAAMNPCPCGYFGDEEVDCQCTSDQVRRYQTKVSGPFLDRLDMLVHVPRISYSELRRKTSAQESSASIRSRVTRCYEKQLSRQQKTNAQLNTKEFEKHCRLSEKDADLFDQISEKMTLSLRSHTRVLRVARTIADLEGSVTIESQHLMEAVSLRNG